MVLKLDKTKAQTYSPLPTNSNTLYDTIYELRARLLRKSQAPFLYICNPNSELNVRDEGLNVDVFTNSLTDSQTLSHLNTSHQQQH